MDLNVFNFFFNMSNAYMVFNQQNSHGAWKCATCSFAEYTNTDFGKQNASAKNWTKYIKLKYETKSVKVANFTFYFSLFISSALTHFESIVSTPISTFGKLFHTQRERIVIIDRMFRTCNTGYYREYFHCCTVHNVHCNRVADGMCSHCWTRKPFRVQARQYLKMIF